LQKAIISPNLALAGRAAGPKQAFTHDRLTVHDPDAFPDSVDDGTHLAFELTRDPFFKCSHSLDL
jgi:hypothetical protein